ncbi:serine/threonine-protein phosphatase 4 regulatory subunit 2-like [Diospyros lotus]|uniref:serine/threonine-protein phosphatase 4 regulatory subunit 2-like n=1 Tax=Diospyros lotus TaxID=55363 RepID=UPI00225732D0|nr:serine/threonine-protein phosphatase 4 regulatory subunit 2-like [Diospyros lotus]
MHIEKNVFDNVSNIVMDVKGNTKDNAKARIDLKEYCRRRELELVDRDNENIRALAPHMDANEVDKRIEADFPRWFNDYWVVIQTKARRTVDAPTSEQPVHVYQEDEDMLLQPTVVENEQLDSLRDNLKAEEVEEYFINDTFVVEDGEPDNEKEDKDADTTKKEDEEKDIDEEDDKKDINEEDDEKDIYEEDDEGNTHE